MRESPIPQHLNCPRCAATRSWQGPGVVSSGRERAPLAAPERDCEPVGAQPEAAQAAQASFKRSHRSSWFGAYCSPATAALCP
jgi:hypothetical protein